MSDYISRKAAVEIAQRYGLTNGSVLGRHSGLADCIAIKIEGLPAADVEPVVRANWQFLSGSPGTVRCSNCGAEFEENPYAQYRGKWIGCPACRAKMQMIMDLEVENNG